MSDIQQTQFRLFENDLTITGKHATYLKFLVTDAKLYDDYISVYMNAAVVGFFFGKKADKDNSTTDRARIYADAFSRRRNQCLLLYRLITLLDNLDITLDERLDRAFRYESNPEKDEDLKQCYDIFNAYVRAGIEELYNSLTDGCTSRDDYIKSAFTMARNFKEELDGISYEDKLEKLLEK